MKTNWNKKLLQFHKKNSHLDIGKQAFEFIKQNKSKWRK